MHLLYLTFGNTATIHIQAAFSIFSFLREATAIVSVNVITDQPEYYKNFNNQVRVIPVNSTELKTWEGEQQYFWRVKLKAIERICQLYSGEPVMYLDSDTFLIDGLATIQENLLKGKAYMHENEGPLSRKKSKTEKLMWQQVHQKTFGGILMQPSDCMWNAGLVATPNTRQQQECRLALAICDEMCTHNITRRLIEQYALSIALQQTYGLHEARQQVAHYWQIKHLWNDSITAFFLKAYCHQWSFEETLAQMKQYDFTALPIALRIRKTNIRLKKMADRFFPPQNHVYLQRAGSALQS